MPYNTQNRRCVPSFLLFRLAPDIVQTRTKPYQAEVVNEHRQSLIFLTDIISRALFIFRRPPLEGLFCGANTNGLDFVGFQFVLCLRVLIKEPVSPFCNTVLLQLVCHVYLSSYHNISLFCNFYKWKIFNKDRYEAIQIFEPINQHK